MSFGEKIKKLRIEKNWTQDFVAEQLNISVPALSRYESGTYEPKSLSIVSDFAKLYNVSINAVKKYDFNNPIDVIYFHMWLEEEFPYYEIKFDCDSHEDTEYNEVVLNAINEWQQMREKRQNLEISDDEYLEWKLNFGIKI